MKRKLIEIEEEISGNSKISEENKKKYEAIYEQEQEIEKFMKDFKNKRENLMVEMGQKQEQVMQYLDNISQTLKLMEHTPSTEQLKSMLDGNGGLNQA